MNVENVDLNWLIENEGVFLGNYKITKENIESKYSAWKEANPASSIFHFLQELLRQACLFVIQNAESELEYHESTLKLQLKMLEYSEYMPKEFRHYISGQIHLNKLLISQINLDVKFDVQIKAENCYAYCRRQHQKVYKLDKVIQKKYIQFTKCTRMDGCNCSYGIVAL